MSLESFFKDKDVLMLVDNMAQRYGMTPMEVISCQTLYDFNFNSAVMLGAMSIEAEIKRGVMATGADSADKDGKQQPTLQDFGIKRTIRKKAKE
jgi:hypothetical protein